MRTALASPTTTRSRSTLVAAIIGFFLITLDAVVVNVTLPTIRADLGGGIAGLQWVVDGYTLMFAALLLTAGSVADRVGARTAFGSGVMLFVAASVGCGLAPNLAVLVAARFAQGAAAAAIVPASMALIRGGYPDPRERGRAIGVWAMGGAVASSAGPVVGGLLNQIDWRLIFFINVPAGIAALLVLAGTASSTMRVVLFDVPGQVTGVIAMGAVTFGAIEAGSRGFDAPPVIGAFIVAVVAAVMFWLLQKSVPHPMLPLTLLHSRTVRITLVCGFAFMVGYYGLPFVMSLFLQQHRGLTALQTGVAFGPMMLIGLVVTPFSARLAERFGRRTLIVAGLAVMAVGLVAIVVLPSSTPVWAIALLMILVGLGGPLVAPPATALLLDAVPADLSGVASGVFNTSRQIGGALAIAVFGGLLAQPDTFVRGVRVSLVIAAVAACLAGAVALRLPRL